MVTIGIDAHKRSHTAVIADTGQADRGQDDRHDQQRPSRAAGMGEQA